MIPPAFILVRPQMGENIGAAARAMLNFGLERLRVVDPRDGWPNSKAIAMASGAGRLLEPPPYSPMCRRRSRIATMSSRPPHGGGS